MTPKSKVIKSVEIKGVIWTKESVKTLLQNNDAAVIQGMKRIYEYQTEDEKSIEDTRYHNNVGFSGCDANILSSFVNWHNTHGYLSPKQMIIARKKMKKYSGQLLLLMAGQLNKPKD